MPRIILTAASLTMAGLLCSGCWPRRFTTSPGVSGTVLDSQTHSPLGGVEAVVSLSKYPPDSPQDAVEHTRNPTVTSNDAGHFLVPSERRWGIYIWPVDRLPEFGLLVVRRDGYETSSVPVWSRSVTNIGTILLKPLTRE
jgi:hypothetical protein